MLREKAILLENGEQQTMQSWVLILVRNDIVSMKSRTGHLMHDCFGIEVACGP